MEESRAAIEVLLAREAEEADQVEAARRRVLARQDCLKCLDALHGLNQQLLFDLDRQLGKQARVEAALHLQARYRNTPAARIRCTQHVGRIRVRLREYISWNRKQRAALRQEARTVAAQGKPPLVRRVEALRRRQRTSEYRGARDSDAGSSLPKDSKHPVYQVVMKTQAELIEAERRLDRLEKYLVETFPSDERTRRASAATELLAAPISPWGQSKGDGLALGALRKVSKEARRGARRDEDEDGDEAPPSAAQKLSAWQEKERRRLAAEGAKAKHEEARALEAAAGAAERQRVVDMQSRLGHTRSELARLSRVSSVDGGGARRLSAAVQAVGVVAAGFAGPPTAALATPTTTAATAVVASRPRCGCASSTASATRAPPHPSAVASATEAAGTGVAPVLWLCSPSTGWYAHVPQHGGAELAAMCAPAASVASDNGGGARPRTAPGPGTRRPARGYGGAVLSPTRQAAGAILAEAESKLLAAVGAAAESPGGAGASEQQQLRALCERLAALKTVAFTGGGRSGRGGGGGGGPRQGGRRRQHSPPRLASPQKRARARRGARGAAASASPCASYDLATPYLRDHHLAAVRAVGGGGLARVSSAPHARRPLAFPTVVPPAVAGLQDWGAAVATLAPQHRERGGGDGDGDNDERGHGGDSDDGSAEGAEPETSRLAQALRDEIEEAGRAHDLARSLRSELDVHKATAVAHIERARGHIEASKGIATARNLGARERQLERQAGRKGRR